jgi:hypothetical protein
MNMSVEIIENAIPASLVRATEAAWPKPDWQYWHRYQSKTSDKFASMDRCRIPAACLAALDALALAVADKIGDSFIDYDLHAAGMHMMPPGGYLGRHLDAEFHPLRSWKRTHSVVMFVNSQWGLRDGGQLLIEGHWPVEVTQGTAVVFETNQAWHEVATVTGDQHRKTLALFGWQQCDIMNGEENTRANFQDA